MSKREECIEVAKVYCKKNNYVFIYANEYDFGYEDKNGNLIKKSWNRLYEELGGRF